MVAKTNYLNNRDILKEIHLSKITYCSFVDPSKDHQFDAIVADVNFIDEEVINLAKSARADRIKRSTGEVLDLDAIPVSDLVFRVTTWEHIPLAPPKVPKIKKKKVDILFDFEEDLDEVVAEIIPPLDNTHIHLNFPPFYHYRLAGDGTAFIVGKSHWKGDLATGVFSKDHGQMTPTLARMFIKLCDRYATRSNWRGYSYNEEMRGTALLQLAQVGLRFDEAKSQNPFAYMTAIITNSFTRVLNIEKKMHNIRDDILEINGLNPSWSRLNQPVKPFND
jgi:hypothetical protein